MAPEKVSSHSNFTAVVEFTLITMLYFKMSLLTMLKGANVFLSVCLVFLLLSAWSAEIDKAKCGKLAQAKMHDVDKV